MKKIKSFKIKNCEDCFYWQSNNFCAHHEMEWNQPPGINKEIKEESKDLLKWRIILWSLTLFLGFAFFYCVFTLSGYYDDWKTNKDFWNGYFYVSALGVLVKCAIYLPILGWEIHQNEKAAQKELKELNQKKSEWIIEYE